MMSTMEGDKNTTSPDNPPAQQEDLTEAKLKTKPPKKKKAKTDKQKAKGEATPGAGKEDTAEPKKKKKKKALASSSNGESASAKKKQTTKLEEKASAAEQPKGEKKAGDPAKAEKSPDQPASVDQVEDKKGHKEETDQREVKEENKKETKDGEGEDQTTGGGGDKVKEEPKDAQTTLGEGNLLQWCRKKAEGYAGVEIKDFNTSWRNGLAFCALVHHYRPQAFDFASLKESETEPNLKLAFGVAEKELGIPAYLSAEDVAESDGAEIMTYLVKFHSAVTQSSSTQAAPPSSFVIHESDSMTSSGIDVGAALANVCSTRPRLAPPKKAAAGPGRRLPTRGVRPGEKITGLKSKVEDVKASGDNTIYCQDGEPLSEEAVQKLSPRKRVNTGSSQASIAQAAAGASLRKASVTSNDKQAGNQQQAATKEGEVVIPAWKQKLIDKKREKAAAEAASAQGLNAPASEKKGENGDGSEAEHDHFMEGFLFKRDAERWVRKWFVLNGPHLMYFGDRRTEKNQFKPLAILSVEFISSVTAFEEKANAIEITDNANAKFHVYASSKEEFELWLDALKAAQQSYQPVQGTVRRGTVVTAPSWSNIASAAKEGELLLLGGGLMGKKWKKAYFLVKDGFLEHSKAKGAKPMLRLPLLKCEFNEHEDKVQKYAFRVSATKKKLVLAAETLDEMHGWMNALLKQRLFMEEAMSNISRSTATSLTLDSSEGSSSSRRLTRGKSSGSKRTITDTTSTEPAAEPAEKSASGDGKSATTTTSSSAPSPLAKSTDKAPGNGHHKSDASPSSLPAAKNNPPDQSSSPKPPPKSSAAKKTPEKGKEKAAA